MQETKPKEEHPLVNILVNVVFPSLVLSFLSKDPAVQERLGQKAQVWHLGPVAAVIIALLLPLGYGIWHYIRTRKGNFFSALGLVSVLLSGALTLYLWNRDGTVKPGAGLLFGIKEGLIPFVIAIAILVSRRSETPLIRLFIYNDSLFDIRKIETSVRMRGEDARYDNLLAAANRMFAGSFLLSALLNVCVALWFFRHFDEKAMDALEQYNMIVGKITAAGFVIIGIPLVVIMIFILSRLKNGLRDVTGLEDKDLWMPR